MGIRKKEEIWDGSERRGRTNVLVVNDEDDARELIVRFLRKSGFAADGTPNDAGALVQMTRHFPRCVVLDMQAGGVGSSLRILDQIRTHTDRRISTARVVLCAPSPKNRSFSFQSGADAFVVRPFHIRDLIAQVTDAVDRPQEERARHRRDELADS